MAATNPQTQPVVDLMQNTVNNPTMPPGAQFNPTMQNVTGNELISDGNKMVNPTAYSQAPTNASAYDAKAVDAGMPRQTAASTYNASMTGGGVQMGAAQSGDRQANATDIAAMYKAFLGRDPDPAGLQHWVDQATKNGMSVSQVQSLLQNSQEAQGALAAGYKPDQQAIQNITLGGSAVQAAQGTASAGSLANAAQTTEAENQAGQATAQQGEVDPRSTVQGQLAGLTQQLNDGTASWANPAMRNANDAMASRGLGNSSMAGAAVTTAAMEAALPIAAQDAKVFENMGQANLANRQQTELFNKTNAQNITLANLSNRQQTALQNAQVLANMDMANLNNRQQAAVVNAQAFTALDLANLNNRQQSLILNQQADQQAMLSDQAAANASKQFNASSQQQNDQFFATMGANISQFNAAQQTAISQYNSQNKTQTSQFNAGQSNAMKQFNAEMANQRDQFNKTMSLQIDQSNVSWRREVNTANTAAKNAANQINAQNMLNLSNTAMNNLWQQFRDEADYAFTAGENTLNRQHNLAMAALQNANAKDMMQEGQKAQFAQLLGSVAGNILTGFVT